jgi:hypothetical protein
MAKTYNTLGTVAPGDVLRANSGTASYNGVITNSNNFRVPPACRLKAQSAQSLANTTETTINFPVANDVYDTDSMHPGANPSRIQPTTAGIYMLTATIYLSAPTTTRFYLAIAKNAAGQEFLEINGAVSGLNISTMLTANGTTDFFTVLALQTSGGARTVNNALSFFTATWLGQTS